MVIMDEISSIKAFFQSHSVHLSTAWLEGCVNWCKEEHFQATYTLKDLQHKVFEQWLLLDLRDVEVPCLPPGLSNTTKYVLNDNYSLQVMKVIDISRPKHWQLQRIRKSVSKNAEPEIESSKRVLQLTLTDGVQEVEAMEYKPISCLNLNLSPGIKIRLLGPITVRRGRLMLENKNVKVLGGEVEELIVPNAAENVLASILKLPLNPKPNIIEESLLTANSDMFNDTGKNATVTYNQNGIRNNVVNPPNVTNRSNREQQARVTNEITNATNSVTMQNYDEMNDLDEEEELRIAAQIDMLMEVEQEFEKPPVSKRKSKTPDLFDDADIDDSVFENIDIPNFVDETPKPSNNSLQNEKVQINSNVDKSLKFEDDLSDFFDESQFGQSTKESEWKPSTSQKPLIFTIEKLKRNIPNICNGKFKIKAKFISVVNKLTVADDEYYIVIKVGDDTGDLDVRLHTDVVSDFAECRAQVVMSLKAEIMEDNAEAQRKVVEILKRIKEKLVELNQVVEVQVSTKEKFPVIVNVIK